LRDFVSPLGDGLALATGPRAPDNDGNSKHRCSFVTERISLIWVVEVVSAISYRGLLRRGGGIACCFCRTQDYYPVWTLSDEQRSNR